MIPMQWAANVKIPFYGWYGRDDFASEQEARGYVAKQYRMARKYQNKLARPSYASRSYTIRARPMRFD